MRFRLTLRPQKPLQKLTLNYNYPFAGWIYSRIDEADSEYATFLHQKGYLVEGSYKTFKHFTFSNFEIRHKAKAIEKGEDFVLLSDKPIFITVSFFIDKAAEDFIIGLFKNQKVSIYDNKYQADFSIEAVESLAGVILAENSQYFIAQSPIVIAEKRPDGKDDYLMPTHPNFAKLFAQNLLSKYESIYGKSLLMDEAALDKLISFRLVDDSKMKSRLRIIKQNKESQTKVRGYENFIFELKAPSQIIEVGFYGGFGKYTSAAGMGYCEVYK
ncbi:MAG: CRISPR-associated endoribonuclease Cas6 [Arcicella sp.]|jgi:CRISPR-associated endoribonuclease Cas6|nr:CRISPR-associated endoribonuclease Cas6 [Arcicella sp.]